MRVFLGLRHPQVSDPAGSEDIREEHIPGLGREGDRQAEGLFVWGHAGDLEAEPFGPGEAVEILLREGAGQLPAAVRAEIEEEDRVPRRDRSHGPAFPMDYYRLDKLVGYPRLVRSGHGGNRVGAFPPFPAHHRPESPLGAVPSVVPVHRVVPPPHRSHLPDADLLHLRQ